MNLLKSVIFVSILFANFVISYTAAQDANLRHNLDLDATNVYYPEEKIITAGQPSENDIAILKQAGVTAVINMRTEGEFQGFDEKVAVESNDMSYIHIPVAGAEGITKENAQKLDEALATLDGKVFIHCSSGNRVGGLFVLRAFYLQGKKIDEAMRIGEASGLTRLKPFVEAKIKQK